MGKNLLLHQTRTEPGAQGVRIKDVVASFVEIMMLLGAKRSEIIGIIAKAKPARLPKSIRIVDDSLSHWAPVLTRWADDPLFTDEQGQPKDLPFTTTDDDISFSRLVELELPGEQPELCRDVLISIDSIARLPSGALRWLHRDAVAGRNCANTLYAGEVLMPINGLLASLKAGLTDRAPGAGAGPFQRSVNGFELHPGDIEAFRGWFSRHGMDFLWEMDDWLTHRARKRKNARRSSRGTVRPYIGLFMTMEPARQGTLPVYGRTRTR